VTSGVRWLVMLSDPAAGFTVLRDGSGRDVEILAADRDAALVLARYHHEIPRAATVVSRLEYEERERELAITLRRRRPA
jgi:hypothetical protein